MKKNTSWLLVLIIIVALVIVVSIVGNIYSIITNQQQGTWIGNTESWNYYFGFLVYWLLFIPSLILYFLKSKYKYLLIIILILPILIFDFVSKLYLNLMIDFIISMVGWLLVEGILRFCPMCKKK